MRAVIFAGQGAQRVGMGGALFAQFPDKVAEADAILGYSIADLCLRDPHKRLGQTQYTQCALYVTGALAFAARNEEAPPHFVAGHSLGEYNALHAAGVFDFATGLRMVRRRGQLMAAAGNGAMAAILGLSSKAGQKILQRAGVHQVEIANDNSPSQFVLAGAEAPIAEALNALRQHARHCVRLPVSGAFHSSAMGAARLQFHRYLLDFDLAAPKLPVMCNYTGRPHVHSHLYEHLSAQMDSTVRWTQCVQTMLALGVDTFHEIGPHPVLTPLVRQIREAAGADARSEPPPAAV